MKTTTLLAAALLVLAAPALSTPRTRRQAEMPDYQDPDAWCQNRDLRDPEVVGWIWNDWTVGWHMDVMISKSFDPPNKDWVVKFGKVEPSLPGTIVSTGVDSIIARINPRRWDAMVYLPSDGY